MDICSKPRRDPFPAVFLGQSLVKGLIFAPELSATDLGDSLPHSCQEHGEPGPVGSHRSTAGFCGCHKSSVIRDVEADWVPSAQSPGVTGRALYRKSD